MVVEELAEFEAIEQVMTLCAADFYNQQLNNSEDIKLLAHKFQEFAHFAVACREDEAAGFIAYYCNNEESKSGYLSMIIVRSTYQHQGIGSTLLRYMIDMCRQKGYTNIRSEVNINNNKSVSFFQNNGFYLLGKAGENSVYYELKL